MKLTEAQPDLSKAQKALLKRDPDAARLGKICNVPTLCPAELAHTSGAPVEPPLPMEAAMNSADLVARLRAHRQAFGIHYEPREVEVCIEAADRIEALEARLAEAKEVLREVVAHLGDIEDGNGDPAPEIRAARRLVETEDGRWVS